MSTRPGTHSRVIEGRTPAKGRRSDSTAIAIAMSKSEVSTDDKGKTRRGNLTFVTRLLLLVRLVVPNLIAETKNAHGIAFTPMPPMSAPVMGCPDTFDATTR